MVERETMTFTIWAFDVLFIALVALQIRERPLTRIQVFLPIALVVWAGVTFVHSFPSGQNSRIVLGSAIVLGAVLGAAIGALTQVRVSAGRVVTCAGFFAAGLWIFVMGIRLAFQLWATGDGQLDLGRFDYENAIGNDVWPAALVLMAGATVLARIIVIVARGRRVRRELLIMSAPSEVTS